ncbi:MAG: hypothetical protein Pars2KO_13790 [Parasphingorhabdus sp.]
MNLLLPFLCFAIVLLFQSPTANANEPKQSEILREANLALITGQFEKATQLYYAAREQLISKGDNEFSDELVYQLIEINRSIADAMAGGEFGDPCKPLARANENMVALIIRGKTERRPPFELELSLVSRQIQQAIVKFACSEKIANRPDPKIAGIYYLRGVMETASGLKLDENGRYEWYLVVGSLDLVSKGVWHRQGDHIQLISDQEKKEPKIIITTKQTPFAPRIVKPDEYANLPDNPNYAIIFESDEPNSYPPRAYALFGYADGREKMVGSVGYGRLDLELDGKDLPTSVRLLFSIEQQIVEVKTDVVPAIGFAHEMKVRRPDIRELGVTTMVLRVDGDTLKSSDFGGKGAYVKAKPKP